MAGPASKQGKQPFRRVRVRMLLYYYCSPLTRGSQARLSGQGHACHCGGIVTGRTCHVADDDSKSALARRVPGANLRGRAVPSSGQLGLPETVVRRVRAAVEAERERPCPTGLAAGCPEPSRSEKSAGRSRQPPETGR